MIITSLVSRTQPKARSPWSKLETEIRFNLILSLHKARTFFERRSLIVNAWTEHAKQVLMRIWFLQKLKVTLEPQMHFDIEEKKICLEFFSITTSWEKSYFIFRWFLSVQGLISFCAPMPNSAPYAQLLGQ